MGADPARKRAGKKTKTGMSESQLREFAAKYARGGEVLDQFPRFSPAKAKMPWTRPQSNQMFKLGYRTLGTYERLSGRPR